VRAAAIFGPGYSGKDLEPFQKNSEATWIADMPTHSEQADAILIFGGDGTVHRYLPQLVRLRIPLLVVPCGSGNDFARALGLRGLRHSLAAWQEFCSGTGNVRTIDLGLITPFIADPQAAGEAPTSIYFCCVGGVGLDAEIARRANRLPRWLRAHGGYVLSLPSALLGFAPVAMKISSPDAENPDRFAAGNPEPMMVAAFANTQTYGGGMKVAPRARLDDGRLDVCIIGQMNRFKLLCLFPSVFFGRHLGIPEVEYFQTERLRVETDLPRHVYADGEYVCRTPIEVSVARGALRVIGA
jgi:diacylglycerol kinase (ATP)